MAKQFLLGLIRKAGYKVERLQKEVKLPSDFEELHTRIIQKVRLNTMTSPERLFGLIEAVKYVHQHKIEGDIVECGVWKGGSMMAIAETLMSLKDTARRLYLYDTFEGMSEPTSVDATHDNLQAEALLQRDEDKEQNLVWAYSTLDEVTRNLSSTRYPSEHLVYVQGKVEDTIPGNVPEKISLLRLDTDWYESTKHELEHLYHRLTVGGVLILDDYGYWKGARKAVDEFIASKNLRILLNRLDETGRIAIKQQNSN